MADTRIIGSVSVEASGADDTIICRVRPYGLEQRDAVECTISYENAWTVFSNLASYLHSIAESRTRSAATGDCRRCNNLRLVTVQQHGRDTIVNCPDCRKRYDHARVHFLTGSHRV